MFKPLKRKKNDDNDEEKEKIDNDPSQLRSIIPRKCKKRRLVKKDELILPDRTELIQVMNEVEDLFNQYGYHSLVYLSYS